MLTLFWGGEVTPGKPFPYVPPPEEARLHLSQASLSVSCPHGEKVALKCKVTDGPELQLCTLKEGQFENCNLDLFFDHYTEFIVDGKASVHITGYFVPEEPEDQEEFGELPGGDDDEDEDDEDFNPAFIQLPGMDEDDESDDDFDDDDDDDIDEDDDEEDDEADNKVPKPKFYSNVIIEELERHGQRLAKAGKKDVPVDDEDDVPQLQSIGGVANGAEVVGKKRKGSQLPDNNSAKKPATPESGVKAGKAGKAGKAADKNNSSMGDGAKDVKAKKAQQADVGAVPQKLQQQQQKGGKVEQQKKKDKPAAAEAKEGAREIAAAGGKRKIRKFENGFILEDVSMGLPDGKVAKPGKKVVVKYVGRLASNNKIFDQTKGKATFTFRLGVGEVIKGWERGVEGMRVGDKRKLTVPPQMGYGSQGVRPTIPPNATLLFDVELVDVK